MKTTLRIELTDRMAIARQVVDSAPEAPGSYTVECKMGGYLFYIEVAHDFDVHTEIVARYGGYRDVYTEIRNEYYDVQKIDCLDADGELVEHDLTTRALSDILNHEQTAIAA